MQWFGNKPFSRACKETEQVRVPVGESCFHCTEPIEDHDFGYVVPLVSREYDSLTPAQATYHYACFLRQTIGSLGHVLGRCTCSNSTGEGLGDPEGMTPRQAAEAAVKAWERKQRLLHE
jgi:hypothetical protein